jgi:2-polyprenyl-3-methyl-5-hydroxy-6-metoxy-1,4-benzoquinol methylase
MNVATLTPQYEYASAEGLCTSEYLTEPILACCRKLGAQRVLDVGCGNGGLCGALAKAGFTVAGCDLSEDGIRLAREAYPDVQFHVAGVYDNPPAFADGFDVVVSTEVIEHLYLPRFLPRFAFRALRPEGHLILSTPYHGYLKNLVLALAGRWDSHLNPLWDGGHIKFWSPATLSQMLSEEGFCVAERIGAGRMPWFWKSMILMARRREELVPQASVASDSQSKRATRDAAPDPFADIVLG